MTSRFLDSRSAKCSKTCRSCGRASLRSRTTWGRTKRRGGGPESLRRHPCFRFEPPGSSPVLLRLVWLVAPRLLGMQRLHSRMMRTQCRSAMHAKSGLKGAPLACLPKPKKAWRSAADVRLPIWTMKTASVALDVTGVMVVLLRLRLLLATPKSALAAAMTAGNGAARQTTRIAEATLVRSSATTGATTAVTEAAAATTTNTRAGVTGIATGTRIATGAMITMALAIVMEKTIARVTALMTETATATMTEVGTASATVTEVGTATATATEVGTAIATVTEEGTATATRATGEALAT